MTTGCKIPLPMFNIITSIHQCEVESTTTTVDKRVSEFQNHRAILHKTDGNKKFVKFFSYEPSLV